MDMLLFFVCYTIFWNMVSGQMEHIIKYANFKNVFDTDLYQRVLDEDKCRAQLKILTNNTIGFRFMDATAKYPSGVLRGNLQEMGDYFECLAINEVINEVDIQGKHCTLKVPIKQELRIDTRSPIWRDMTTLFLLGPLAVNNFKDLFGRVSLKSFDNIKKYFNEVTDVGKIFNTSNLNRYALIPLNMTFGVCIPHACTPQQVIDYFVMRRVPVLNFTYSEHICRLPDDKPVSVADYVAMVIFSTLAVITIISTSYDVYNIVILKRDQSQLNRLYQSFSVYTNTRRLLTFNKQPGALDCVDGIRTISMLWVVVGHTYSTLLLGGIHNSIGVDEWTRLFSSVWVNSGPLTVDTFFFLSGMLSVYSTVAKFNRGGFIRNIHFYYLLRLLRMFPILAAVILLQASFFHHASDGPYWTTIAGATEACRKFWWSALLHVQNFINPLENCIAPSWYISVDVQLYILSPLVIIWMFGKECIAWVALAAALTLALIASTYYSFTYNFPYVISNPDRAMEFNNYFTTYYTNTSIRASPFLVGMAFGYLLHLYRDKRLIISRVNIAILWSLSLLMLAFSVVCIYPALQKDNDLQIYENILNSYMKIVWTCGIGWVVFACVKGYGGPVNWFLSLHMWKLPARLSYGVYLLHEPLILIVQGSWVKTHYFSDLDSIYRFMSDVTMSFMFSFFLTILVDSPFSTLLKLLLTGKLKPQAALTSKESEKMNGEHKFYKTSL